MSGLEIRAGQGHHVGHQFAFSRQYPLGLPRLAPGLMTRGQPPDDQFPGLGGLSLNFKDVPGQLLQFVIAALQCNIDLSHGCHLLTAGIEALLPKGYQDIQS